MTSLQQPSLDLEPWASPGHTNNNLADRDDSSSPEIFSESDHEGDRPSLDLRRSAGRNAASHSRRKGAGNVRYDVPRWLRETQPDDNEILASQSESSLSSRSDPETPRSSTSRVSNSNGSGYSGRSSGLSVRRDQSLTRNGGMWIS